MFVSVRDRKLWIFWLCRQKKKKVKFIAFFGETHSFKYCKFSSKNIFFFLRQAIKIKKRWFFWISKVKVEINYSQSFQSWALSVNFFKTRAFFSSKSVWYFSLKKHFRSPRSSRLSIDENKGGFFSRGFYTNFVICVKLPTFGNFGC